MTIEFEIFAHFCSKLMNIRSGWRELRVCLIQRESHEVLESVSIWLDLKCILNLGSILDIKTIILRSSVEAWARWTIARLIRCGAWVSELFDFIRQVLRLREAFIMAWWKVCRLRSYFRISLVDIRKLEWFGTHADDLASELLTTWLWLRIVRIRWLSITWWH
jgi:hypothetical protein